MPRQNTEGFPSPAGAAGARTAAAPDSYWRSFPVLERTLGQETPPVLAQIEATCRQLDEIRQSGSGPEKARAAEAMQGYVRALEVYRELLERRDHSIAETGNSAKPGRDK